MATMNMTNEERLSIIERDLPSAAANGELIVEVQPKYDMLTGKCVSAEALVRWIHPELGKIYPGEFISLAEHNGELFKIDIWMMDTICRYMRKWMDNGINPVPISINQSRLHIGSMGYLEGVAEIMQKYDIWPSLIELETNENSYSSHSQIPVDVLYELQKCGFRTVMYYNYRDMITEFSRFDYDILKIDCSLFNRGIPDRAKTLMQHIIRAAHERDMTVVAEGVENKDLERIMREAGCDYAQGFLYSPAVSIADFEASVFGYSFE